MSYNGAGVFVINSSGQPVVAGTAISPTVFNALTADLATGLSTAITKDGQTTATANIPLGGFKITNLGTGTAGSDAARVDQIPAYVANLGTTLAAAGVGWNDAGVLAIGATYPAPVFLGLTGSVQGSTIAGMNVSNTGTKAVTVTAAPSPRGNTNSISTAFTGDLSRVSLSISQSVTGAATLGLPATGYYNNPEASVEYTYLLNQSGWNQQTSGNDGRTSVATHFGKVDNYGQGDTMWGLVYGYVSGAKVGATSFLANPAVTVLAGQVDAGANGVYLNPYEIDLNDGGFDVAGAGWVVNLNRTNNTGALNVFWAGYFVNGIGTKASDAAFAAAGKHNIGLDLTTITLAGNLSAITLVPTQRIYFGSTNTGGLPNGTSPGGSYISENSSVLALTNGSAQLQLSTGQFTILAPTLPGTDFAYSLGGAANRWQSTWTGALSVKSSATINAATYTVLATDCSLVFTGTNCTITLPAAATYPGRILVVKVISANTVVSASSNVYPQATAVAGTAILSATAGKFAMLQSDGTAWATMMSN